MEMGNPLRTEVLTEISQSRLWQKEFRCVSHQLVSPLRPRHCQVLCDAFEKMLAKQLKAISGRSWSTIPATNMEPVSLGVGIPTTFLEILVILRLYVDCKDGTAQNVWIDPRKLDSEEI